MPKNPLFDWRKLFSRGIEPTTVAEIEASLAKVKALQVETQAQLEAKSAGRREVLLYGSGEELRTHDAEAEEITITLARCSVGVEDLTAKLSAVRIAAAEAERRARYDAAAAQAEAASVEMRRVYPDAVAKLRALLRQLAEAEIAVAAANRDRPAGAAPLEGPEGFRLGTGMAEKVVKTEDVELWADFRGKPQSLEMQPLIVDDGTGHGRVPQGGGTGGVQNEGLRKIAFTATTFRPADDFKRVPHLAASLMLPPMHPGELAAWEPVTHHHKPEGTAGEVLARLDVLARATPRGPKPVQVRYEVVNPRDLFWDPKVGPDARPFEGMVYLTPASR